MGEPDFEGAAEDRLDELLRASGWTWPGSDAELDRWLAAQPLDASERAWLEDVVRRRQADARAGAEPLPAQAAAKATLAPRPIARLGYEDLALLNGHLLELVRAGAPLPRGLEAVGRELGAGRLAVAMDAIRADLEGGASLSDALGARGAALPPLYRALVAAGEQAGDLAGVLALLHEQAEVDAELSRRVREALVYPLVVGVTAFGVVLTVTLLASSQFKDVFTAMAIEVPWLTQLVLSVGEGASTPWLPLGVLLGVVGAVRAIRSERAVGLVRGTLGASSRDRDLGEVARALSGFLARGVALPRALRSLAGTQKAPLSAAMERAAARVEGGESLGTALRGEKDFSPTFVWFVGAAEERGDLAPVLADLARRHERRYESSLRLVQELVGPVALTIIGVLVAVVVLAMFLPIFTLQQQIG